MIKLKTKGFTGYVYIILFFISLLSILIAYVYLITFSNKEDDWSTKEYDRVNVLTVGPRSDTIDFSLVPKENTEVSYKGKTYEGYNDPKQKAMAKEILSIIKGVIQSEASLVNRYNNEEGLIKFILGIHLTESDTYNGRSEDRTQTYIPLMMVRWEDYSWDKNPLHHTVEGGFLNFTNYNWKDFKAKYDRDNPSNYFPRNNKEELYTAGFHYKSLRSTSGAIGPLQQQPATFSLNEYVRKRGNGTNFDQIIDIENYVLNSKGNGRGRTDSDRPYSDIFNYPDQVSTVLGWITPTVNNRASAFKRYGFSDLDIDQVRLHVAGSYYSGDNGWSKILGGESVYVDTKVSSLDIANPEEFQGKVARKVTEDLISIMNDAKTLAKASESYEKAKGHGSGDIKAIEEAFTELGWKVTSKKFQYEFPYTDRQGNSKTYVYSVSKGRLYYPVRSYFQGEKWYDILMSLAYGVQDSPTLRNRTSMRKVTYNYMTEQDGRLKIDEDIRTKSIDRQGAIGYKGKYPIYDQAGAFMKQFYFCKETKRATPETFSYSACTVFTMTSMANGLGLPTLLRNTLDLNNDGYVTPMEWWVKGRMEAFGRPYYDVTQYPSKDSVIVLESISSLLSNNGYKVLRINQGTTEGYKTAIQLLKQGYPIHVRVKGKRGIAGYYPIEKDKFKIDYNKFNMDDLSNYEYLESGMYIAGSEHSLLGVDVKNIKGEDYISIVNSSFHHVSRQYDSNLVWFKASDLLKDNYCNSYAIVGYEKDPNWSPLTTDYYVRVDEDSLSNYVGVNPWDIVNGLRNVIVEDNDAYTKKLSVNQDSLSLLGNKVTVSIGDRYETQVVNKNTVRIVAGTDGGVTTVVEISNVTNPRRNKVSESKEETILFDLKLGTKALLQIGDVREDGEIIYRSLVDQTIE